MRQASEVRLPLSGEAWRHYKGGPDSLYTIVGTGRDENGFPVVVYVPYRWSAGLPPIYTQLMGRFLQTLDDHRPRFRFEREVGDDDVCPFLRGFVAKPDVSPDADYKEALRKIVEHPVVGWLAWIAGAFEAARPGWKNHSAQLRDLNTTIRQCDKFFEGSQEG